MNRKVLVPMTLTLGAAAFVAGIFLFDGSVGNVGASNVVAGKPPGPGPPAAPSGLKAQGLPSETLVRDHSPVIGPRNAPVTIVEFFDPSCEACRAFYPEVKQIMARYPNEVRLVVRYAPNHPGSEEAVRILEAARPQNMYVPVLEAVLAQQPQWHDGNMESAWSAAAAAGLNVERARAALNAPAVTANMQQDIADGQALGVKGTPTYFVNGTPLIEFGLPQLEALIRAEVEARRR